MTRPRVAATNAASLARDADDWRRRIIRRTRRANIDLQPEQAAAHAEFLALLSVWNARMNLTALTDRDEAVDRLILEPVLASRLLSGAGSLLDVGSGGGSPAIPLKIQLRHATLCMVESKVRKGAFLREVVRRLGLEGVKVESRRFEELLTDASVHESCDVVTIRAVRVQLATLVATQAFLKPGGRLALFRGPGEDALPSVPTLTIEDDQPLVENLRSRLVILRKTVLR